MSFQFFQCPLPVDDDKLEDLNRFLGQQRVAMVNHHIVNLPGHAKLDETPRKPLLGPDIQAGHGSKNGSGGAALDGKGPADA